jgi:hypothetical protein
MCFILCYFYFESKNSKYYNPLFFLFSLSFIFFYFFSVVFSFFIFFLLLVFLCTTFVLIFLLFLFLFFLIFSFFRFHFFVVHFSVLFCCAEFYFLCLILIVSSMLHGFRVRTGAGNRPKTKLILFFYFFVFSTNFFSGLLKFFYFYKIFSKKVKFCQKTSKNRLFQDFGF